MARINQQYLAIRPVSSVIGRELADDSSIHYYPKHQLLMLDGAACWELKFPAQNSSRGWSFALLRSKIAAKLVHCTAVSVQSQPKENKAQLTSFLEQPAMPSHQGKQSLCVKPKPSSNHPRGVKTPQIMAMPDEAVSGKNPTNFYR